MNGGEGPSPVMRSAFLGLCPQCGAQTIFGTHIVRFEPRCRGCGLDYSQLNVGDGPAAFLILIVGARSEEHTSELQSPMRNSSAVFCLKQKNGAQQLTQH